MVNQAIYRDAAKLLLKPYDTRANYCCVAITQAGRNLIQNSYVSIDIAANKFHAVFKPKNEYPGTAYFSEAPPFDLTNEKKWEHDQDERNHRILALLLMQEVEDSGGL